MTESAGPLIDETNFPQSEEWKEGEWKEGGGDLEDQLLWSEGLKEPERTSRIWISWPRYVRWSGLIGLGVLGFALAAVCCLYGFGDNATPLLGTRLSTGLYELGDLVSFNAPHLMPERLSDWHEEDFAREYETFKDMFRSHRGVLSTAENDQRYEWFKRNLKYIHAHNAQSDKHFSMAPNQFTDMSFTEWSRQFTELPMGSKRSRQKLWTLGLIANSSIPESVNWHDKGCVTPIKDQAQCGSCWAFSSTGAIEGAVCAQTGRLVSLSEQQLIDCSAAEGTHGCNGGFMDNAFQYVMDVGGICSEDEYPYHARQEVCRKSCKNVAKISAIMDVPPGDVKALKAAIALHGPVAAGVQADRPAFQFYHKGVLNVECGKHLNHAILVTGYGTDTDTNLPYWLVKNSWGATWGDEGYIKLAMNHHGKAGECGVLLAPSVPIVNPDDIHL